MSFRRTENWDSFTFKPITRRHMQTGEIAPVISVRMRKHNRGDVFKTDVTLQRTQTSGSEIDHDIRLAVLNEVPTAGAVSPWITTRAAKNGEKHRQTLVVV